MKLRWRDVDIHYEEIGSGKPLICLHGANIGSGRWAMDQYEPAFAGRDGWRRIYPDLLGYGPTGTPDWLTGHDHVLDGLLGFIDALIPGERFALAAHSWGGYIARGVVHHRPEQVLGLMLYTPDFDRAKFTDRNLGPKTPVAHEAAFDAALRPDEEWMRGMLPAQTLEVLEAMRTTVLGNAASNNPPESLEDGHTFSFDPDDLAEPFPGPSLILTGRQDWVTGYKQAWPLLDKYPRATLTILDRAGHILGIEQPALFKALANEWLDRVEEWAGQGA
jgi:pimeloyl-ACP methyl ester carboxylesterase